MSTEKINLSYKEVQELKELHRRENNCKFADHLNSKLLL